MPLVSELHFDLLKRLSEIGGIPGREERVRELVEAEVKDLVDELRTDALGNLITVKRGSAPDGERKRIMLSSHMDEIGFIVKYIDDKGFVRVQNAGGFDTKNLYARNVIVWARGGDLPGILNPGGRPVHIASPDERKKIPEIKDLVVDLGLPADEVKKRVRIGDPVTLVQEFREVGDLLCGKDMDDRASVFVQIEVLRALQGVNHPHDVVAVFSTQEEVGLRGATVAAYSVEPDIGVALDVTLAVDTPGVPAEEATTRLSDGVAIKVYDTSMISTRWLVDEFIELAEQSGIRYQLEILMGGGTDGGAIQRSRGGVPTVTLSLPTRYIHSVVEAVHKADVRAEIDLLVAYLSR
nr:M42 family metallopeptidase [Deinobacterium chartae]